MPIGQARTDEVVCRPFMYQQRFVTISGMTILRFSFLFVADIVVVMNEF